MKQLLLSLIILCGLLSAGAVLSAPSAAPHITPMDIRGAKGTTVLCEGVLYIAQDSTSCAGMKGPCTSILVDGCSASLSYAKAAQCNIAPPSKAFMDDYRAANLPDLATVENDAVQEVKRQFPVKFGRADTQTIGKSPEFEHIFLTKWNNRPHVKVMGLLEGCSTCPECFPSSQCTLNACKAMMVKPPQPK